MSSTDILSKSASPSPLFHHHRSATSFHPDWPTSFYNRHNPQPADIGRAPSRHLSSTHHRASHSSMSSSIHAPPLPSQSKYDENESQRRLKISRSNSTSSRTLSSWVRRRKGDEANASTSANVVETNAPPESPLSSAVKGLSLPPVEKETSPTATIQRSNSSNSVGLSRIFSVRRKGRTISTGTSSSFANAEEATTAAAARKERLTSTVENSGKNEQTHQSTSVSNMHSPPLAIIAAATESPLLQQSSPNKGNQSSETVREETIKNSFRFPAKSSESIKEDQRATETAEQQHQQDVDLIEPTTFVNQTASNEQESNKEAIDSAVSVIPSSSPTISGRSVTSTAAIGNPNPTVPPSREEDVEASLTSPTSPQINSPSRPSLPQRIRKFSLTRSTSKASTPVSDGTPKMFGRSPSILNALDLRHSNATVTVNEESPAVQSSTASPSMVRDNLGRRHTRGRTVSRDGLTQFSHASPSLSLEERVKKLSLKGFNPFKATQAYPHPSSDTPKTPEIEGWKHSEKLKMKSNESEELHRIGGKKEQEGLGLGLGSLQTSRMLPTPELAGSPMSSRALLRKAGVQSGMSNTPRVSASREGQQSSALGFVSGEKSRESSEPGPEFVSGLAAISSGWTEASSMRSSMSRARPRVPSLDLTSAAAGNGDVNLPPYNPAGQRPYSLISTDTEGNDTPIIRLRKLVVDTEEGEDEQERQSQLFFRPPTTGGTRISPTTSSIRQETEYLQDRHSPAMTTAASDAGLLGTAPSVTSSGSSTINVRLISEQIQRAIYQRQRDVVLASQSTSVNGHVRSNSGHSSILEEGSHDNELQIQQQQPPRTSARASKHHSRTSSGPPRTSLSNRDSLKDGVTSASEKRRGSTFSSQTDSSVYEAVLSRATSTRLHTVPLRKMKVEEWAQKIASVEQSEDNVAAGDREPVSEDYKESAQSSKQGLIYDEKENLIPDIPDESLSEHELKAVAAASNHPTTCQSDFTFRAPPTVRSSDSIKSRQSSSNLSEAARLGKVPAKRVRRVQSPVPTTTMTTTTTTEKAANNTTGMEQETVALEKSEPIATDPHANTAHSSLRTLKPSRSGNALHLESRKEKQKSGEGEEILDDCDRKLRKSESEVRLLNKSSKEDGRHAHSRSLSTKKSYLTSEEAATAKRREQEEKGKRSKERRKRKEVARQEAYAEKKRQDPLLKMRLALAGLTAPEPSERTEEQQQQQTGEMYSARITNDSNPAFSKTSFHTAGEEVHTAEEEVEEEEEERHERVIEDFQRHHRRNQHSTASAMTMTSRSRASSIGTLAPSLPFPKPPHRYDTPTMADDGTILARARLQSQEGMLTTSAAAAAGPFVESWEVETPKAKTQQLVSSDVYMVLDGQRVRLSRDATIRESPVKAQKPLVIIQALREQLESDEQARKRAARHKSHIPEVMNE